jgi:hypothetical protein
MCSSWLSRSGPGGRPPTRVTDGCGAGQAFEPASRPRTRDCHVQVCAGREWWGPQRIAGELDIGRRIIPGMNHGTDPSPLRSASARRRSRGTCPRPGRAAEAPGPAPLFAPTPRTCWSRLDASRDSSVGGSRKGPAGPAVSPAGEDHVRLLPRGNGAETCSPAPAPALLFASTPRTYLSRSRLDASRDSTAVRRAHRHGWVRCITCRHESRGATIMGGRASSATAFFPQLWSRGSEVRTGGRCRRSRLADPVA